KWEAAKEHVVALAAPDQRARVALLPPLHDGGGHHHVCRARKLSQLVKRLLRRVEAAGRDADEDGTVAVIARAAHVTHARHLFFKRRDEIVEVYVKLARHARL